MGSAALLGAMVLLLGLGCTTRVQHELDEREANRIVATLRQAGVEAVKAREEGRGGRFAVDVPRGQSTRAIQVLLANDLPRRLPPGFGDVYSKPSLVPTADEQQGRFLHALSGELARTLEAVAGVREARVHVVVPRTDPLSMESQRRPPRAAVLLRVLPGKLPMTEAEVKRLVTGSVDHLEPEGVSVVIHTEAPGKGAALQPAFAQVGPVSVSPDSRGMLVGLFTTGLVLILLLAAAVALLALRLGRLRRELAAASAQRATSDRDPEDTGPL